MFLVCFVGEFCYFGFLCFMEQSFSTCVLSNLTEMTSRRINQSLAWEFSLLSEINHYFDILKREKYCWGELFPFLISIYVWANIFFLLHKSYVMFFLACKQWENIPRQVVFQNNQLRHSPSGKILLWYCGLKPSEWWNMTDVSQCTRKCFCFKHYTWSWIQSQF